MICKDFLIKSSLLRVPTRYFRLCKHVHFGRTVSQNTSNSTVATALTNKLTSITKQFDNVLGIAEVRSAQSLVQAAEDEFMKSRRLVQDTRNELLRLQNHLRDIRSKLDRIPREDERYLQLATEEHKVLIAERKAKTHLEALETLERDQFSALSAAVRGAHEKERSRAERTKYWSIIGSACGAVLGILGSTMINMRRMNAIRITVEENNEAFIARIMEEVNFLSKAEQPGVTKSDTVTDQSQSSNDFLALLKENRNMLKEIDAKVETLSNEEALASKVEELLLSRSPSGSQDSGFHNSEKFLELDEHIQDLTWWSKVNLIASITSSAGIIFYVLSR